MEFTIYTTNRDATFDVDDRAVDAVFGAINERTAIVQISTVTGKKVLVSTGQVVAIIAKAAR